MKRTIESNSALREEAIAATVSLAKAKERGDLLTDFQSAGAIVVTLMAAVFRASTAADAQKRLEFLDEAIDAASRAKAALKAIKDEQVAGAIQ